MSRRTRDSEADVLTSMIQWLARESDMEIGQLQKLESDLRARYGARRHYIAAHGILSLSERNTLICEAWLADVPAPTIARKFHLSARRVRQICAGLPRQASLIAQGNVLP